MPSASAKLEKQASTEVSDPLGKVLTMVEKKVRNLEKRKGRLDNYRAEHQAGKELNEDQMNAIKKYDVVVESLEILRDFQKSVSTVMQEHVKQAKKQAKKEQLERQQQEMQRVRDILLIQDILNNMGAEEVRAHFLTGTHGAVRLTEEELNHLDELFKLVVAERNKEDESLPPFEEQLTTASDHLVSILESKNKEILGTTYKALRELIFKIHECGYFDKTPVENTETPNDVEENATNFDDYPEKEEEEYDVPQGVTEIVPSGQGQQQVAIPSEVAHSQDESVGLRQTAPAAPVDGYSVSSGHVPAAAAAAAAATTYGGQNRPLTDLLSMQGGFNFLQESQVEPESPHMDPAVVAAHPMAPPAMGYHTPGYPPVTQQAPPMGLPQAPVIAAAAEETLAGSTMAPSGVRQQQMGVSNASQQPQQPAGSSPAGVAQDYDDPAQPIPTQTFTNQSFAAMQTMMQVPPAANFVQATIGHGVLPAAAAQMAVAAVAAAAASAPQAAPPAPADAQLTNQTHTSASTAEFQPSLSNGGSASQSGDEQQISNNRYQESEENEAAPGSYPHSSQGNNYNQSQNTFVNNRGGRGGGGRGRGATNGFSRGGQRGGYGSGNRGGYRGNFNASDSYNNNYRRGGASSRGAPRGGGQPGRGGSNPRGRGNFRGQ